MAGMALGVLLVEENECEIQKGTLWDDRYTRALGTWTTQHMLLIHMLWHNLVNNTPRLDPFPSMFSSLFAI